MADPGVFELGGVLRRYEWGSTTLLQGLLGDDPDGRPAAELWFGAHPGDPSPALGSTLDRVLDAAGERPLPYLLKLLGVGKALSMQVHPDLAQARAGFAREQAAGIPREARERTYVDPNHKPELLCALTPFDALCGFRPVADTLALLDELAVPELGFVADRLRGPDGLRAAFTALLTAPDPARIARAVAAAASPVGPLRGVWLAAQDFPEDVGVALAVLLNHVTLGPGEAIYLEAGNVHAYLRGLGVEVMANSDNVLRCGLTPKHIDVGELLAITRFDELAEPRWPLTGGRFAVTVPDFALRPVHVDGEFDLPGTDERIVLVTEGRVEVDGVVLCPGRAAFVRVDARLRGRGRAFVASPG